MDHFLKNLGGVTLKSLLENPSLLQTATFQPSQDLNIEDEKADSDAMAAGNKEQEEIDLEKKLKDVESDYFAPADFGAAFLGPNNLWDKTYGDDDFKLEYMELDEFLSENGLPVNTAEQILNKDQSDVTETPVPENNQEAAAQVLTPPDKPVTPSSPTTSDRTASPVDVNINFDLSPTDIALASVPGQEEYDPRTRCFSEEELKPQPMIKKSRKVYVPHEAKDDKYWDRRRKNNIAAKRSRDARRIKENQISMRAAFLEKENSALRTELMALKKENSNLKSVVKSYERKLGIQ
ncbi:thyrotroph embryonic factor-like [Acanthaster planci]|uniref:Thyrotroph embryonic factor-like n=1 Tax=Acanthaster planci TaxID=133434 RepID=A0A8B7ZBM3_ACAPL|nr:thyrotroph embryonic factor-like [Acanthaster planci]